MKKNKPRNNTTNKTVAQEIATTGGGRDITRGYIDSLPYITSQDKVLKLRGGNNYEIYEEVLRDDQVSAVFTQRRLAVVAKSWSVQPGGTARKDKKAAEMIEDMLNHIRWDTVTERMLFGRFYGYAVAEALWVRDGSYISLDALKVRNRRRFVFSPDFNPLLLTSSNPNGEPLPEHKFWHFSTGADHDDEPYGLGLAHWLYWPVFFKRNQQKFWLYFLERFGQPTVIGKYPLGTHENEQKKLHEAVRALKTDTGITLPDGMLIELLQTKGSGTADYAALYDRMNQAISKVVVGQTMTTDDGASQSQASVHMDVREDLVRADAMLVNDSFNRSIVRWLTDWNCPGAAYPIVTRELDTAPDLSALATRDKMLFDMGFRPTAEYVERVYGVELDKEEKKPVEKSNEVNEDTEVDNFAEGEMSELEKVLDAIDGERWLELTRDLIEPVLTKAKTSPDDLMADVAGLYPELSTESLEEQLARIIFCS